MDLKKDTHTVIKKDDAVKYLTPEEIAKIGVFLGKIADGRVKDNKKPINHYYVCNIDEPYAEEVLQAILQGEERKAFCESIKSGKCSTRDYGPNQYKDPCYECCLGCAGAINMECPFVCTKVAEHYHPSEED